MNVIVVGCGVSGLSSGIRLLQRGFAVTIVARDLPPHTTSNIAAAIWYPYKAYPIERVLRWGRRTLESLYDLMAEPAAGVSAVTLIELLERPAPDPWWCEAVRRFRQARPEELPPGYGGGYCVEVPFIETPAYMTYLLQQFQALGGRVEQRIITSLAELQAENRLIVNCSGIGARQLARDETIYPIRGQIVCVSAPAAKRHFIDEVGPGALAYIIPRRHDCILGGTAEENDWNLDSDPEKAVEILRKCRAIEPALAGAEILEHLVGLRPGRHEVRLELEPVAKRCAIIHNYGHGGAGFTLSWGCAEEVAALAIGFSRRVLTIP
jgi:D-amino-acid oxidase